MKKFKVRVGLDLPRKHVVITVDDEDGHFLRSTEFVARFNRGAWSISERRCSSSSRWPRCLAHIIAGVPYATRAYVIHKNHDDLDFRKENLQVVDRDGFYVHVREGARKRATTA